MENSKSVPRSATSSLLLPKLDPKVVFIKPLHLKPCNSGPYRPLCSERACSSHMPAPAGIGPFSSQVHHRLYKTESPMESSKSVPLSTTSSMLLPQHHPKAVRYSMFVMRSTRAPAGWQSWQFSHTWSAREVPSPGQL